MQRSRRRIPLTSVALRARRRRRARIIAALVVLGVIAFFGIAAYLLRDPGLRVERIAVVGADASSSAQIAAFARGELAGDYYYIVPRDHVLLYNGVELSQDVEQAFPALAGATASLTSLSSATIAVSLRLPAALWCGASFATSSVCLLMDANGVAYAAAPTSTTAAYVDYYGALSASTTLPQFLSQSAFKALSSLVGTLAQKAGGGLAASVAVDSYGNATLTLQNGVQILFELSDAEQNAGQLLERFVAAEASEPMQEHALADFQYIDLRFGTDVYYKLKGEGNG